MQLHISAHIMEHQLTTYVLYGPHRHSIELLVQNKTVMNIIVLVIWGTTSFSPLPLFVFQCMQTLEITQCFLTTITQTLGKHLYCKPLKQSRAIYGIRFLVLTMHATQVSKHRLGVQWVGGNTSRQPLTTLAHHFLP